MKRKIFAVGFAILVAGLILGFGVTTSMAEEGKVYTMPFDAANFENPAVNPFFPLKPGMKWTYKELDEEGEEEAEVIFEVTKATKTILGVECTVIHDRVYEKKRLVEDTIDYYATDKFGNVWYFGEDSRDFQIGKLISVQGSWLAGAEGAMPGLYLAASPEVGMVFKQEVSPGQAEDMGEVVDVGVTVRVRKGKFENCVKIRDWNPLEPGVVEYKYYAPDVGVVLEEEPLDKVRVELYKLKK